MKSPSRSLVPCSWYTHVTVTLIVSLFVWTTNLPGVLLRAEAAQLTNFSDTISTSKPGVGANHTISFVTPTGVPADGSTIEINIPDGFNVSAITEDDIDIEDDGVDLTTAGSCGAVNAAVNVSSQTISIEICVGGGGAITAASTVTIQIGDNATTSGVGTNKILNHASEGSYELTINGTMADSGATQIIILDQVTISGSVETYFNFEINGVNAGESINNEVTTTFSTTTATSIAFGTIVPSTEYILGQELHVTTNAANGFVVEVMAGSDLVSSAGATIDSFVDGTATGSPIAWASPSAQIGNPDTYGHWGLTTEDNSLTDGDSFGSALYVGDFVDTGREVMYATSSADGLTENIGTTRVGYKMQVSTMQEAATQYTTRLTYIATPIF